MHTTDNEPKMRARFKDCERNGCLAHICSISSKTAFNKNVILDTLRKKLRSVVKKNSKSSSFKRIIKENQLKYNVKPNSLKQKVTTRFAGTLSMLKSLVNDPNSGTTLDTFNAVNEIQRYEFEIKSRCLPFDV